MFSPKDKKEGILSFRYTIGAQLHKPMICETHHRAQLGGITRVPLVRGVAEFTRLRIDRPAHNLTLQFRTIPSRFEVTTSVHFSVVSPPGNTHSKMVGLVLEGNLRALSSNEDRIVNAIKFGLSEKLDIDISRIKDLDFKVS